MIEMYCRKCKKIFIPAPEHIYRDEKGFYCSWHCFNHRKDKQTQRRYKSVMMCSEDGTPIKIFDSANSAAEYTGIDIKHIQRACREQAIFHGFIWKYES